MRVFYFYANSIHGNAEFLTFLSSGTIIVPVLSPLYPALILVFRPRFVSALLSLRSLQRYLKANSARALNCSSYFTDLVIPQMGLLRTPKRAGSVRLYPSISELNFVAWRNGVIEPPPASDDRPGRRPRRLCAEDIGEMALWLSTRTGGVALAGQGRAIRQISACRYRVMG